MSQASPSGPRVLLIPGINGNPTLLSAAAPKLFLGRRALAFDHRFERADRGLEQLADRALATLDRDPAGDEPAYVCGESFGGVVALTLARRHPDRVRGLVLLSTFARYPKLPLRGERLGMTAWRLLGDRLAGGVITVTRPFRAPGALGLRFSRRHFWAFIRDSDGHPPAYRSKCEASLAFDARPWLGSIRCPTFVLTGSWDPVVPISAGRELARLIPDARLAHLRGGHVVHFVRAEEAGLLITRWMSELEASPAGRDLSLLPQGEGS